MYFEARDVALFHINKARDQLPEKRELIIFYSNLQTGLAVFNTWYILIE
jgi:hypothetical protein